MYKKLDILATGYEIENVGHLLSPFFAFLKAFAGC